MFTLTQANFEALLRQYFDIVERSDCVVTHKMAYDKTIPSSMRLKINGVSDYARWRTLDLVRELIESSQVQGNVAEAGVWKGDFSRLINYAFPNRKLYLFDTFEGFLDNQIQKEYDDKNISEFFLKKQRFTDSSVDLVMQNMILKEQCIICKGNFKDTSATIEDKFAFVSLDMDLYEPMMDGLDYFYPRLSEGGYIFLHDYNHIEIHGIKKCVADFEAKIQKRLPKFPLSDQGGTLVLTK